MVVAVAIIVIKVGLVGTMLFYVVGMAALLKDNPVRGRGLGGGGGEPRCMGVDGKRGISTHSTGKMISKSHVDLTSSDKINKITIQPKSCETKY